MHAKKIREAIAVRTMTKGSDSSSMNSPRGTARNFVTEVVWLPTYLGAALVLIGTGWGAFWYLVPALLLIRLVLELMYRLTFAESRHEISVRFVAFVLQCIAWGGVWVMFGAKGSE